MGHVIVQSCLRIFFPISTNQLGVLLTECLSTNQIQQSVVYAASLGISNTTDDNSNVNMGPGPVASIIVADVAVNFFAVNFLWPVNL